MNNDKFAEEFEKLAAEVSEKAAKIECAPDEYRDGLQIIIDTLKIDLRASEETSA
jgi:hypothetical protein